MPIIIIDIILKIYNNNVCYQFVMKYYLFEAKGIKMRNKKLFLLHFTNFVQQNRAFYWFYYFLN